MFINGADCSIIIKTSKHELDVPYSDETLREAVSVLQEEASIEGSGNCGGLRKVSGVTGCVITPLSIVSAPLLFYLAMGAAGNPIYISETRNLYKYELNLLPMEDTDCFDLIQERANKDEQLAVNNERKIFERCRVLGFELRIMRSEAIKLKLDLTSESKPIQCQALKVSGTDGVSGTENFSGDCVKYEINGREYSNIYGITLVSKKQGGTRTEIWIKRALQSGADVPAVIEDMTIKAQLLRDNYEYRYYGAFRITLKRLIMVSDETEINTADTVIGPLRYYVAGVVKTEVFNNTGEFLS